MRRLVVPFLALALTGSGPSQAAETAPRAPSSVDGLRVTLLGTGNPRPSPDRFGPSTLVEAGTRRILVDAGRGATIRLLQVGGTRAVPAIDLVLLTHLHSDHVVGLPDLWLTGWIFGRDRPLALRGPAGTAALAEGLERAFAFDVHMRRDVDERFPAEGVAWDVKDLEPGLVFEEDGIRITAFPVLHGPVVPAFGYRIEHGGRSVVFSGDTSPSEAVVAAAQGVDVLIHDVISPGLEAKRTGIADPEKVRRILERHTTPEDAGRIFARVRPRLAVYSHVVPSPARPRDLIPATRKTYAGPLAVGHDLMTISIGERVRVGRARVIPD